MRKRNYRYLKVITCLHYCFIDSICCLLIYLNRVLIEYENSDITVYLTNVVKKITEEDLSSYFNNKNDSLYEKKPKSLKSMTNY